MYISLKSAGVNFQNDKKKNFFILSINVLFSSHKHLLNTTNVILINEYLK